MTAPFEDLFGAAQHAALVALGSPERGFFCQAVILGRGGDDGAWMRLLNSELPGIHRVGALVVTDNAVAYAELYSKVNRPERTTGSALRFLASATLRGALGGARKVFGHWVWTARRSEIRSLEVRPAVDSPHGPYAEVVVQTDDHRVRFGIDVGSPSPGFCLALLRHVAGQALPVDGASTRPPRTDGAYVFAGSANASHRQVFLAFQDEGVVVLDVPSVSDAFRGLRASDSDNEVLECRQEGGRYVIPEADQFAVVLDDERLIWAGNDDVNRSDGWPPLYTEMCFVDEGELLAGWGTVRAAPRTYEWDPVLDASGRLTIPEA